MIQLLSVNSTYQYPSLGMRYLYANLNELQKNTVLTEFTIKNTTDSIIEEIKKVNPKILAIGVYIWNVSQVTELLTKVRNQFQHLHIVLGGPEVSYEQHLNDKLISNCDVVICGEADLTFYEYCKNYFNSINNELNDQIDHSVKPKIILPKLPDINKIQFPYEFYTDEDIKNKNISVELSRGCPYKCQYCLSSLDKVVRSFSIDEFLVEIEKLILRGARSFKFIDRTFNLSLITCEKILNYFLNCKYLNNLFLHFEMVPDRLPEELKKLISKFPKGVLQFEIGLQTMNPTVAKIVSRNNKMDKVKDNFEFLNDHTGVHIHADLIAGLPGEDLESFGKGFDLLNSWCPQEIQVGILKRLKGTPITQIESKWSLVYSENSPFEIISTSRLSIHELEFLKDFSVYWDKINNRGHFPRWMNWFKNDFVHANSRSLFNEFSRLVDFFRSNFTSPHQIDLSTITHQLYLFCSEEASSEVGKVKSLLLEDYYLNGKRRIPEFLKDDNFKPVYNFQSNKSSLNKRQLKFT